LLVKNKNFEIFCGTGGVGKTTLATARAVYLSSIGKRVLLITIDPSKRLKEILSLKEEEAGIVSTVKNPWKTQYSFDALLMNPTKTMESIASKSGVQEITTNRILKILSKPYGGLNEILSIIELDFNFKRDKYDVIILDTPPGAHFMDFLESCSKIKSFFDKSFMEIFNYLGKRVGRKKPGIFKMVVTSGVKKLLRYLKKVTGAQFIDDFIDAISAFHLAKGPFLDGIKIQEKLKDPKLSNWFLVTSVDQDKFSEALEIRTHAKEFFHEDTYLLVNKSLSRMWDSFNSDNATIEQIKNTTVNREKGIEELVQNKFKKILFFDEVIKSKPIDHVISLTENWDLKE
jgi:anion-transporting  ArsA/GET3 family ATPase